MKDKDNREGYGDNVHGCYPRDFGPIRFVRELNYTEAAKLLNIDSSPLPRELMINKGFIVLGLPLPRDYGADLRSALPGKEAVYHHDGAYHLITWRAK